MWRCGAEARIPASPGKSGDIFKTQPLSCVLLRKLLEQTKGMGLRFSLFSPLELLHLCRVEWAAARATLLIERNHHSDGAFYTGERRGRGSDERGLCRGFPLSVEYLLSQG